MNLNLFLDREFALAMQLIEVIRKSGNNDNLSKFENELKQGKTHFQAEIKKFYESDDNANIVSQNTFLVQ